MQEVKILFGAGLMLCGIICIFTWKDNPPYSTWRIPLGLAIFALGLAIFWPRIQPYILHIVIGVFAFCVLCAAIVTYMMKRERKKTA